MEPRHHHPLRVRGGSLSGVSPEDAERLLVKPMETELQSLEGIKQMNAVARQGVAIVNLEFEADFNKDKVMEDVRAKVDLARGKFPPDAEEPIIEEANFSGDPVIGIVLSGAAPERELVRISRDLQDRLETVPGVLEASLSGGREEFLEVTIDPVRMEAYNVTTGELAQVIGRNNQLVPAGDLRSAPASSRSRCRAWWKSPPTSYPCRSRRTATA
uniref:Efflux RND transporter permease subunit n=1 Tax=Phenylobacterium glaciei TaxID=2803784 RepID=A0A974SBN2_9CAUL|nr:efflux RND transporter permease subunit [Phenylobacterium glaciei]